MRPDRPSGAAANPTRRGDCQPPGGETGTNADRTAGSSSFDFGNSSNAFKVVASSASRWVAADMTSGCTWCRGCECGE